MPENNEEVQVVEVAWEDSFSDGSWAHPGQPGEIEGPFINHSVGYLILSTKASVVLSQTFSAHGANADRITIPRANVRRITKLYPL